MADLDIKAMVEKHPYASVAVGVGVFIVFYMLFSKGSGKGSLQSQQLTDQSQIDLANIASKNTLAQIAAEKNVANVSTRAQVGQTRLNDQYGLRSIWAQGGIDKSLANIEAQMSESEMNTEQSIFSNCGQTGGSVLGLFSFGTGGSCPTGIMPSTSGFNFPTYGTPGGGYNYPGYPPSYAPPGYGYMPPPSYGYGAPGASIYGPGYGAAVSPSAMSWLGSSSSPFSGFLSNFSLPDPELLLGGL
jgi:hypothetical protein